MIATGFGVARTSGWGTGGGCDPGWYWVDEVDDSFMWQEDSDPFRTVSWSGTVQLLEEYDADCYVVAIELGFTGPDSGGTLDLNGDLLISYTIQFPSPFDQYSDVGSNAIGDLVSWSPPEGGWPPEFPAFYDFPQYDINANGADEFIVQGTGLPGVASGVSAFFSISTDLLGQTVNAQIHVGPDLCRCSVTGIFLPGESPPAPPGEDTTPPAAITDLQVLSVEADSATLGWTAPGDDGMSGQATWYDVRYTDAGPITEANFYEATYYPSTFPGPPGTPEQFTVSGLSAGVTYWFAIRTSDEVPNWSDASNSPSATIGAPPAAEVWAVFIHAHEDDWQLFESPNPYYDYVAGDHLLFIYMTAGDAGQGASYWQARESASQASVIELIGPVGQGNSATATFCYMGTTEVCHTMTTWTYDRSVSVYMRLPDSGVSGGGFGSTGFQSMSKLRDGLISNITAVDGSATYTSWQDLYLSLGAIVDAYAPHDSTTTINGPDFDRDRQTSQGDICSGCIDHADHLAVADAVQAFTIGQAGPWSRAFFIDYPLGFADPRYPVNLDSMDYAIKKRLFMAYNTAMITQTGIDEYGQMPWFWENCFQRDYYRSI